MVFLVVLLRPPPSMLLPNLPHTGHKISVVLFPPSPSHNLSSLIASTGIPILTGEEGMGGVPKIIDNRQVEEVSSTSKDWSILKPCIHAMQLVCVVVHTIKLQMRLVAQ